MERIMPMKSVVYSAFETQSQSMEQSLEALVAANNGLVLLEGHNVVLRRDYHLLDQVRLLAGGWSGLEPLYTDFVGPGMLTAAVTGEKFCQPLSLSILVAIKELAFGNPHGILIILMNHPSARMNFCLAVENAKREHIPVQIIFVSDDSSGEIFNQSRKGLAGVSLIIKVAGAMADQKRPLEEIFSVCSELSGLDIATVSVDIAEEPREVIIKSTDDLSLWSDNNYGYISNDTLKKTIQITDVANEGKTSISIVHSFMNLTDLVHVLLGYVTDGTLSQYSLMKEGVVTPIVILLNNYGSMLKSEMNVLQYELSKQLKKRNIKVERIYSGSVIISRSMGSFSITAMKINEEILSCLDHPVTVPGWPVNVLFSGCPDTPLPTRIHGQCYYTEQEPKELGPILPEATTEIIRRVLEFVCMALLSCEIQMNKLGANCNMGSYGTQVKTLAEAMIKELYENKLKLHCPYALAVQLGAICSKHLHNNDGSLYAVFLDGASQSFLQYFNETEMTMSMWADALENGIKELEYFSELKKGDRTLLDALYPMLESMRKSPEFYTQIAEAAELGSIETVNPDVETHAIPDPGSHTVAIWARAAVEALMSTRIRNSKISVGYSDDTDYIQVL